MQKLVPYLYALALVVTGAVGAAYFTNHPDALANLRNFSLAPPCSTPVAYTVGTIDGQFNIKPATFAQDLQAAAAIWNKAAGKTVLVYDPSNPRALPVNLLYDTRQQAIQVSQKIDSTEASQDSERAQLSALQAKHLAAQQAYADAVGAFNAASQKYAEEVAQANANGGADPATYDRIRAEQASLKAEQAGLKTEGDALSAEAMELQARIAAFNAGVHQVNQIVNQFNATIGGEFEEGQYVRDAKGVQHIDVYAFKNQSELMHTIAHEFGHALGLDHNQNPASIMFPYNKSGVTLSPDDLATLTAACKLP